ncbi:MAG: 3-hydroxyacyl-CoA dehydrogenase NAD-binding domain-containing protein, partial [Desulfobacteraceae bacterium]
MGQLKKIGVIGAGNMGSGIVQKIAQEGLSVIMVDIQQGYVKKGLSNITTLLKAGVDRKIFSAKKMEETLSRITGTVDFNQVADADLIVEAVFEDRNVKAELFEKLDTICSPNTILATNTSSFYVREFAQKTQRPDRFVGLHYFYHPAKNRLLEVIPHDGTSRATLEKALLFAKLHGKTAIVVKDAPGFAVNRFFVPFLNEAARMLEEQLANIATIEAAAMHAFRIGMGPFELMNVTGIPIAVHATDTLGRELGPFYATSRILKARMDKKENWDLSGQVDESKLAMLSDRFLGVCLGVAAALVDEGVASMEDTDRGAKIGLRWSKGPFEIINQLGIQKAYEVVKAITVKYPDFEIPDILMRQRHLGRAFEFTWVDMEVKEQVAYITINRPEAMNALNEAVMQQLEQCFTNAENDPKVKAVVFQGAGKAFIAGADIQFFVDKITSHKIADIENFTRKGHELLLKIENSPKLTIALVDGLSLGGGSELALACQKIIATFSGTIGFPETGIGIFPGLGGMLRLAKMVGAPLAKYFTFTGALLSAEDAYHLGIVSELTSTAEIPATLFALIAGRKGEKYQQRQLPAKFSDIAVFFEDNNIEELLSGKAPSDISAKITDRIIKSIGYKAPLALKMADKIIEAQKTLS